jgi:hypothetical protein
MKVILIEEDQDSTTTPHHQDLSLTASSEMNLKLAKEVAKMTQVVSKFIN